MARNCLVRSDCVVMRRNAPRTRSRTRVCKNQKISLRFSRVSSPHPSTAKRKKKWKGNFWFCFATRKLHKGQQSYHIEAHLLHFLVATEAPQYPRFVVTLTSANTHNRLRIARSHSLALAASALHAFAWWLRKSLVVALKNMDCAVAQTNLYVLAPPTLCAHKRTPY